MKQHSIDLLPDSIRARSQAGLRTGRYVAATVVSLIIVIAATTHVCLALDRARGEFEAARERANLVLAAEEQAKELRARIGEVEDSIQRYKRIAAPLDISAILATTINELPEGVTLDRIDMDAGVRRAVRSPRGKGTVDSEAAPPRVLSAELSGFAPDDRAIAEFVAQLEQTPPFREVSLDFSRTRDVRGLTAREFRLSLRIDLEAAYEVTGDLSSPPDLAVMEEPDHDR